LKRSSILIFGLFSTSFACTALANEVSYTCDYQLGAGPGVKREKIGAVAIAIDVKNKTARIDFGKGWFKTNTLQVRGTNVKETAPSTSGNKLGLFYFDLKANSGGFSGTGFHEFFSACVQHSTVPSTASAPDKSGTATGNPDHRKKATEPSSAAETTVASRAPARATTQYYGRSKSPVNPAWAAEATMNPAYQKQATQSAAAQAPVTAPASPQTAGKATTDYYGRSTSPANPAWAAEATMNPAYQRQATQSAAAPAPVSAPALPRTARKATTDYYGRSTPPANPAWAAEATMNPAYQKQATQSAAATAPLTAPASPPPPAAGKATTDYYGRSTSPVNPAWAAEATMNIDYDRNKLPADASTTSPAIVAAREASSQSCSGALDAAARAANLYFANASFVLSPHSKTGLKEIAKAITECGNVMVEVGGYTDNWGNPDSNKALSLLRANAVVDFLVREGVASSKLKAVGYGQERPIATNRTPAGRRLNRRVEFRISGP